MITCLTGKLLEKAPDEIVISCAGVGYLVAVPSSTAVALPAIGEECTVYTIMNVSENDVSLYGFSNRENQKIFRMLTSVSGVGPKAGLSILSVLTPERVVLAISGGDHKAFTAANGVGPKIGQRIVLELKDKVGKGLAGGISLSDLSVVSMPTGGVSQAVAALTSLGYTGSEAAQAIARVDASLPVPEMIRLALQSMGKGR